MSDEPTKYDLVLLGGPYDGATDHVVNGLPAPETVWASSCRGGKYCGGTNPACHDGRSHTWVTNEREESGPMALPYHLNEITAEPPVAIYVAGQIDLDALGEWRDEEDAGVGRELAPATAFSLWDTEAIDDAAERWRLDGVVLWRFPL